MFGLGVVIVLRNCGGCGFVAVCAGCLWWLFGGLLVFVFDCFCGVGGFWFVCLTIGVCISVSCLVVCVKFGGGWLCCCFNVVVVLLMFLWWWC